MDDQIVLRDNRSPGWFWAQNELIDEYGPIIGVYGIAVYMVLARYANNKSQQTRPGLRKIAAQLKTGRKQVTEAVNALEAAGIITVQRRPRETHIYTLVNLRPAPPGIPEMPDNSLVSQGGQLVSQGGQPGIPGRPELDLVLDSLTRLETVAQKPKPPAKDYLDLAAITAEKQRQRKAPIKHLERIALTALGMKKAPNYRYDALWFEPLTDILDQAEGDVERAGEAIRAAATAAADDALTITSPRSLHGLALQELAERGNGRDAEAAAAKEAVARETMRKLAKEHGHV